MIKVNYRMTRAELGTQLGPNAMQLAHNTAVTVIHQDRPQWTSAMVSSVAWDILQTIDWNNPALMHKDLKWIIKTYLNALCPKEN